MSKWGDNVCFNSVINLDTWNFVYRTFTKKDSNSISLDLLWTSDRKKILRHRGDSLGQDRKGGRGQWVKNDQGHHTDASGATTSTFILGLNITKASFLWGRVERTIRSKFNFISHKRGLIWVGWLLKRFIPISRTFSFSRAICNIINVRLKLSLPPTVRSFIVDIYFQLTWLSNRETVSPHVFFRQKSKSR